MKFVIKAFFLMFYSGVVCVMGNESLAGHWTGPGGAKLSIGSNGKGNIKSGFCKLNFNWTADSSQITLNYYGKGKCAAYDQQFDKMRSYEQDVPDPDTMKYTLGKVHNSMLGTDVMELKLFSKIAPNGASYIRPLTSSEKPKKKAGFDSEDCQKKALEKMNSCMKMAPSEQAQCMAGATGALTECQ